MAKPPELYTHILANPGDRKALCGLKKPLPAVWAQAVKAYIKGHDMKVCAKCSWQAKRAQTRAPREPKLVITSGTLCAVCAHPRSSHSLVIVSARCHAEGCCCDYFEPVCGCGHVYSWHVWSCPPDPWGCAKCPCRRFGAAQEQSPVYQAALFDMTR